MTCIALLVPAIENCGPLNVVLNILKCLDTSKVTPILVSLRDAGDEIYLQNFKHILGCNIYILENFDMPGAGLETIIKENNVSCIHAHGYYPDKIVCGLTNIKKISTIHCMFYKDYTKEYGYLKGLWGAYTHFNFLKSSKNGVIVGCSGSVADYCKSKMERKVIKTIHNGVDRERYSMLTEEKKLFQRRDMGINGETIYIYSGRFIRRKRVPELLEFFVKYAPKDAVLFLIGDGPEKKKCMEQYQNLNIRFIGQVDNPEYYYQISDYIISFSSAEGYPMSIIEAVSCGAYAFLSNIAPHNEFIENNPKCGEIISTNLFLNAPVDKITESYVFNLSAQVMADKYLKLYLE